MPDKIIRSNFCFTNIEEFLNLGETRYLKAGVSVYQLREDTTHLYYIVKGAVFLYFNDLERKTHISYIAGDGNFIGEFGIFTSNRRIYNATLIKDSEIIAIPKNVAMDAIRNDSELLNQWASHFSTLLNTKVSDLFAKEVNIKLAKQLVMLSDKFGIPTDSGIMIDLPLSRTLLSQLTGSTHSTINEILKDWKERKWISITSKKLSILNVDALNTQANKH